VDRIAHRRGATVILSTHTLTEVEQLCDRILVLDRGQLRAAGTIAEVVESAGCTGLAEAFLRLTGETAPQEAIGDG
jgi:ABC-2 type transport system ATP-binding protein